MSGYQNIKKYMSATIIKHICYCLNWYVLERMFRLFSVQDPMTFPIHCHVLVWLS